MECYSVLSKNRKPRITVNECIEHYGVKDLNLNKEKVQEYLDYFELSHSDLLIESTVEALFALQGFCIDKDAESPGKRTFFIPERIKKVVFSYMTNTGAKEGQIDFCNQMLILCGKECELSTADMDILFQAINDLGISINPLFISDYTGTVRFEDYSGNYYAIEEKFSINEILFRIIEIIAR